MKIKNIIILWSMAVFLSSVTCHAASPLTPPPSVYLEELTWIEVRDRIASGARVVIIPSGGTEQNGPQLALGKHNIIVRYTAGQIARRLGNALVAPVMTYVPEGRISPPEGHMLFPGTVSVSPDVYAMVLEDAVRSFKQHGFTVIALIGDHGGTQEPQKLVAEKLNAEWEASGVRVIHVSDYYDQQNGQLKWANSTNIGIVKPDAHAGYFDTAELMAIQPSAVRMDKLGARSEKDFQETGAMGDSSNPSVHHGRKLIALKVDAAVNQILKQSPKGPVK